MTLGLCLYRANRFKRMLRIKGTFSVILLGIHTFYGYGKRHDSYNISYIRNDINAFQWQLWTVPLNNRKWCVVWYCKASLIVRLYTCERITTQNISFKWGAAEAVPAIELWCHRLQFQKLCIIITNLGIKVGAVTYGILLLIKPRLEKLSDTYL